MNDRNTGLTPSERILNLLCDKSFLSLWCYPNLYTDDNRKGENGTGNELCDLLVIFENDIILFSDKHIAYKDTGEIRVNWGRWYRKAIVNSVNQLYGAERWIKTYPNRIYLDRYCKEPFPLKFPDQDNVRFHRIAVTRGSYKLCEKYYGGKSIGSLRISTSTIGDAHLHNPFTVGSVYQDKPFVHILNEFTLEVLLTELDTVSDFVAYLKKKEIFLANPNRVINAAGEEQLVAIYLTHLNAAGDHDIVLPDLEEADQVFLDEGFWGNMINDPQYKAKKKADKISYAWDKLIQQFIDYGDAKILGVEIAQTPSDIEFILRAMAAEPRVWRRGISEAFINLLETAPPDRCLVRTVISSDFPKTAYVFISYPRKDSETYDEYRMNRIARLTAYCKVLKLKAKEAKQIVGIAFDSPNSPYKGGSEDLVYRDVSNWTPELENEAIEIQQTFRILLEENLRLTEFHVEEYPEIPNPPSISPNGLNRAQRRKLAKSKKKKK